MLSANGYPLEIAYSAATAKLYVLADNKPEDISVQRSDGREKPRTIEGRKLSHRKVSTMRHRPGIYASILDNSQ